MELALHDAGVTARDIDVVFADAAAIPELDRAEADAIGAVFGWGGVPVTAPKTMTGRLLAGAASLDVASALLAMRDDVIPPTTNTSPAAEYRLDLVVDEPRRQRVERALVLARGEGGFNSAMVVAAA
jgi:act minimal PKS chain-length factor (CLF/KS beta)